MRLESRPILVAYNGTPRCRVALERALALAERAGCRVDIICVGEPVLPVAGFDWIPPYDETVQVQQLLRERLREAVAHLRTGVAIQSHMSFGTPAREIVAAAEAIDAGLIVLGTCGRPGPESMLLGTTSERVIRLSRVPCLIARETLRCARVLVAADDSPCGQAAMVAALVLASVCGGQVRCLHVAAPPPEEMRVPFAFDMTEYLRKIEEGFAAFVARARELARDQAPGRELAQATAKVRRGGVVQEVLAEAESYRADLLVVGTHGRGFLGRTLLGSVSEAILHRSPVSVLVCPEPSA